MNGIAAIFVAATLTLLSVHTAPTQVVANRDVRSDARPCPCTFGITVSERVPNFDVLVLRTSALASRTQDAQHLPFIPLLSRLNQTSQQASRFDERLQYIHHLHIPVQGSFTLVLRFAPPLPPPDVQPESHLHVLTTRLGRQSSTCPVRLPQHPPQTNPDAEKTPSLRIASVHPRERHTTGENWRTQSLPLRAAQARQERVASARRVSAASRIIGGDLANADLANYLVLLQTLVPIGIASCSGTLVSPTVIITAAHCMLDMTTQVIFQRSLGIPSTRYIHVSSVHIYPDYYGNISSPRSPSVDIAYVRLESRAPLWAKFMKVNMNRSIPVESSFVRNAGYGITNQSQEMSNENFNLYQVDVPLVRDRLCAWIYGIPWQSVLDGRIVCAGYSYKSGCGACNGDSGGPLFQYDADDNPVLIGVVSSGADLCGKRGSPLIHVRTSAYDDFLPSDANIQRTEMTIPVLREGNPTNQPDTASSQFEDAPGDTPQQSQEPYFPSSEPFFPPLVPGPEKDGDSNNSQTIGTILILIFSIIATFLIVVGLYLIVRMARARA